MRRAMTSDVGLRALADVCVALAAAALMEGWIRLMTDLQEARRG